MTKQEIYDRLREDHIEYDITEHEAVFTIDEMLQKGLPHPELIAKNLFVRDDKKRHYYLITVREDILVNLKEFSSFYGTRRLTFASEADLERILGLSRGAVTPLGLLNEGTQEVALYIDRYFADKRIGIHPCDNTATVWMQTEDLVWLIERHGNLVVWMDDLDEKWDD